jgi:hypothetical protein
MSAAGPMLKAAGPWGKTSAKGNHYLIGRPGGVKIIILENGDRAGESDPTHHLFFADAVQSERTAGKPPAPPARSRPAHWAAAQHIKPCAPVPDDGLDDLWRGEP